MLLPVRQSKEVYTEDSTRDVADPGCCAISRGPVNESRNQFVSEVKKQMGSINLGEIQP